MSILYGNDIGGYRVDDDNNSEGQNESDDEYEDGDVDEGVREHDEKERGSALARVPFWSNYIDIDRLAVKLLAHFASFGTIGEDRAANA